VVAAYFELLSQRDRGNSQTSGRLFGLYGEKFHA